jgi:8-oxo-dGTP pyrophosphatase MutT (NUDIX family)
MTDTFLCNKGCCTYLLSKPCEKTFYFLNRNEDDPYIKRYKKAGVFLFDPESNKTLLVQSRGQYWGPPKGSLNVGETVKEAALREVKEETGISLPSEKLNSYITVKGKSLYYFVRIPVCNVNVQTQIEDNDANGIGWFSMDCLSELVKTDTIRINSHCKILIKRLLNIDF